MTLHIAPHFDLPDDAVTETFGILAVKRAGKSNAAVVLAEEMYDAGLPWVAIDPKGDWWGVRSVGAGNKPGLSVVVFGGEHGDVPLEPTSGAMVAELIADKRMTCVLDVSEMGKADQRRFLTDFATRLYKRNREPLHVFCEEADEYIPQRVLGEAARMVGAFETLVKRGGFRGIGVTLITQRSASLNKDVLTQVGTLVAMRTPSPQDRKAILAWVQYHDAAAALVDDLPTLAAGEAIVFSPEWLPRVGLDPLYRIRFRQRRTFDSGATPAVGAKRVTPTRLADVDLAAIKEQMAETIERAKADDPKALRIRIRELEQELKKRPTEQVVETERIEVPVPVLDEATMRVVLELTDATSDLAGKSRALTELIAAAVNVIPARTTSASQPARRAPSPAARREPTAPTGDARLGKREHAILAALATYPQGRTQRQLAMLTGYSAKASTIGAGLSELRKAGYVTASGMPIATEEGMAFARSIGVEELPTGPALLDYWRAQLGQRERSFLDVLIEVYPQRSTQVELAERCGYSAESSTVGAGMSKLRTLGLVTGWAASDEFMEAIT